MARCEGWYRVENRRCDREAETTVRGADGDRYLVCAYHSRQAWSARVAHWHGESDVRRSAPAEIRPAA